MKKTIIFLAIGLLLSISLLSQPNRYYVDESATGQNNGQSWADAFADLHDALALAGAGDEVWVAQGTYRPSAAGNRAARFQMLSGMRLYGGFAATELDLGERDWQAHPTVLDGDIGVPGGSTDNSYNLLYLYRPDSLTLVDGFTFRHALANDPAAAVGAVGSSGAALYMMAFDGEAYPTVRNCIFEQNTALRHGGAVYVNGGGSGSVAPVFEQCRFTANRAAAGNGGALYRNGGSWVDRPEDIKGCVFEENAAQSRGGAIYFSDSPRSDTFDVVYTMFRKNQVAFSSVGIQGAAMQISLPRFDGVTTLSIRNSKVLEHKNDAGSGTAALTLELGNDFGIGNFILDIDSTVFDDNYGTAILELLGWSQLIVKNSSFVMDSTLTPGIRWYGDPSSRCSFLENIIIRKCHHFEFDLLTADIQADRITWSDCTSQNTITNSTAQLRQINLSNFIIDNTYFRLSNNLQFPSTVKLCNSVGNKNFRIVLSGTNVEVSNNIFNLYQHGTINTSPVALPNGTVFDRNLINFPDTFNTSNWIKTNNLWDTDPQFANPDSGDFRLQPCSPAINAGNNAAVLTQTDIFGNPRIQHGTVDIGAVEMGNLDFAAGNSSVVQANCAGSASGSITASGLEACPPVQYEWSHAPGLDTSNLSGLSAGAYTLTATDSKGRSVVLDFSVPAANPPTLQVDGQPISCFGANDAMLSVKPLTGQPPFAYLWSPTGTTDSVALGLGPGPVSVTVTDAWGCSSSFSFDVPEPDTLQFAATVTAASTPQSADGSILVNNVTGGTAPYAYLWEPGGSMESMLGSLNPGLYTLTVTDERGCEAAWTFEVKAIVGTGEAEGQALLLIYPNPAGESANLSGDFGGKTPAFLEIYDVAGRLSRSEQVSPLSDMWQVSLDGLSAGQYMVLLRCADGQVVGAGRLVKR